MEYYYEIFIKLSLATILGAIIGFEREHKNRPAGLRTHVLVCVGAALVQITSIDIFNRYQGLTNLDPARLSAQVISGIGFLGAGTIIREGASVKGLTTAASLWVVACIGLSIGNGSYMAGILTAVFAFIILTALKGLEDRVSKRLYYLDIIVKIDNKPGQIGKLGQYLGDNNIDIRNIEFGEEKDDKLNVYLSLKMPNGSNKQTIITDMMQQEGVYSIEEM